MYLAVTEVKPQDNYLLFLTFKNGEKRQFDMKPYLDVGIFYSIVWDNEADIDPEILYEKSLKH